MTKRKPDDRDSLDMTPMVDVTFLLLIFFMVTASFALQRSISVPNPISDRASTNPIDVQEIPDQPVWLTVDEFGGFLVRTQTWEQEFVGKQNLIRGLRQANSGAVTCLDVNVDTDAKLQSMVDALDAGTVAGFESIKFSDSFANTI